MPRHSLEEHIHTEYVKKEYVDEKDVAIKDIVNTKVTYGYEETPNVIQLFINQSKTIKAYPKTLATEVYMEDGTKITEHLGSGSSGGNVDLKDYYNKTEVDAIVSHISLTPGPQGPQGQKGTDGKSLEYVWRGTELGIRQQGQINYIYTDLQGPQGLPGTGGSGTGGTAREIELQNNGTYIRWRYVGDTTWRNLILIADLVGQKGADGVAGANGKSAYTIAKDNGFVGTESEWLTSLKGQKGADGTFNTSTEFQELTTTNKTVIGSINELDLNQDNIINNTLDNLKFKKISKAEYDELLNTNNLNDETEYHIYDAFDTTPVDIILNNEILKLKTIDGAEIGAGVNFNTYQLKTDNNLLTTNKTIIGAINELFELLKTI